MVVCWLAVIVLYRKLYRRPPATPYATTTVDHTTTSVVFLSTTKFVPRVWGLKG